jgi:hypothetical protein
MTLRHDTLVPLNAVLTGDRIYGPDARWHEVLAVRRSPVRLFDQTLCRVTCIDGLYWDDLPNTQRRVTDRAH